MDLLTKMVDHHVWLVGEMVDRARDSTTSSSTTDRASRSTTRTAR